MNLGVKMRCNSIARMPLLTPQLTKVAFSCTKTEGDACG